MMKPKRKLLYFGLFTALFSIASLSAWLFLCAYVAALLVAVYAVREEQGAGGTLSLDDAQTHVGQLAAVLICLLPVFLLEWAVHSVYSDILFQKIYSVFPAAVSFLPDSIRQGMGMSAVQPAAFLSLAFFGLLPYVVRFFLLPFVLHPLYLMLTAPRPLKELLQHARKTWRARYGALLWRCVEFGLVQLAAIVLYVPFYLIYLGFFPQNPIFSLSFWKPIFDLLNIVLPAFLQTFFFWRVLTVYTRGPVHAAAGEKPDEKEAPEQEEQPAQKELPEPKDSPGQENGAEPKQQM